MQSTSARASFLANFASSEEELIGLKRYGRFISILLLFHILTSATGSFNRIVEIEVSVSHLDAVKQFLHANIAKVCTCPIFNTQDITNRAKRAPSTQSSFDPDFPPLCEPEV